MEQLDVNLPDGRSYPIIIGENYIDNLAETLKPYLNNLNNFVITDSNIDKIYGDKLNALGFTKIVIKAGEESKNFSNIGKIVDDILAEKPNRKSTIIAFGGGVVGDISGFVASIVLRGINFIQVPTTLLAMVDSSVGGKTGVNSQHGKNLIGAFYQPQAVIIDTNSLKTLPMREVLAGYAEVIKYGIICDEEFYNSLTTPNENTVSIIKHCCSVKANLVEQDEKEGGVRALLNLGHTFGHAIENLAGYGVYLHGEAVSIGMVMAMQYAEDIAFCKQGETERLISLLEQNAMPIAVKKDEFKPSEFLGIMKGDKKVDDGKIVLILPKQIGECVIYKDTDEKHLLTWLENHL